MRPYLLDFLIEAHASFVLFPETLFLTINILDRYCSKRIVYRRHYQLVGCTALLIAAKYGEPGKKVPHIKELANMCCNLYDEDMFAQMERHVMLTIEWVLGPPTVDAFLQVALDDGSYDPELEHMARYVSEIASFHKEFVSIRPSEVAKASLALSRVILNRPQPQSHSWASQYNSMTLVSLSQMVHHPSKILVQKYKSLHLSRVSYILEDFLMKHAAIARNNMTPPTPPSDRLAPIGGNKGICTDPFKTPQKAQFPPPMPHGCLTPPITPENEFFDPYNALTAAQDFTGSPLPANKARAVRDTYYQSVSIM